MNMKVAHALNGAEAYEMTFAELSTRYPLHSATERGIWGLKDSNHFKLRACFLAIDLAGDEQMPEFVVAVCTAQRPEMLRRCLESLARLTAPSDARIQIVVIENALTPDSAEIVSAIQQQTPIKIHYRLEPRSGIPFARNAALDLANALGAGWIALIDDDEYAEPDWLLKLYDACVAFEADVANGPVEQICVGQPPDWWTPRVRPCRATGKILRGAATNNILMRAHLVSKDGLALRFDERLLGGSEDVEFFRRATDNGAKSFGWPKLGSAKSCRRLAFPSKSAFRGRTWSRRRKLRFYEFSVEP